MSFSLNGLNWKRSKDLERLEIENIGSQSRTEFTFSLVLFWFFKKRQFNYRYACFQKANRVKYLRLFQRHFLRMSFLKCKSAFWIGFCVLMSYAWIGALSIGKTSHVCSTFWCVFRSCVLSINIRVDETGWNYQGYYKLRWIFMDYQISWTRARQYGNRN